MAKLIKILAASVGGGLVLGAGIRLGEAIASRNPAASANPDGELAERLGELEARLRGMDGGNDAPAKPAPRGEVREWLEEAVTARISEVELRLRAEAEQTRKQILDAVADQIQTRLIQRISKLEEEVAGQSRAMSDLRECSLRTERSVQRLLGGLEKLVVRHPAPAEEAGDPLSRSDAPRQAPETSAA